MTEIFFYFFARLNLLCASASLSTAMNRKSRCVGDYSCYETRAHLSMKSHDKNTQDIHVPTTARRSRHV